MSSKCYICKGDLIIENEISCDLSKEPMHSTCSGMSRLEIQCFKSKGRTLSFYCTSCRDVKQLLSKMDQLTSVVDSLRDEIENLKKPALSNASSPTNDLDHITFENIVSEVTERLKRRNNLIIFNLPELETGGKAEQIASDIDSVREILGPLNVPFEGLIPVRLGKFDASQHPRKRPLKLSLRNQEDVIHSLRGSSKLKQIEKFKSVSLSKDKTPLQNSLYRTVKHQLRERTDAGEVGLRIKYFNDVPKIIQNKDSEN